MNQFLKEFDRDYQQMVATMQTGVVDVTAWLIVGELNIAQKYGLADVLHLLDELALTFKQEEFIFQDELAHAMTSEVSRVLLHPNLQNAIAQMLKTSSLANVGEFQVGLRKRV